MITHILPGARLYYWNIFYLLLCVCFAFQLNGKWEAKKLHRGLICWENFGFSLNVH